MCRIDGDGDEPPAWFRQIEADRVRRLGPGVRVRVNLGECPHIARWHRTIEQGVTGTIYWSGGAGTFLADAPEDHDYFVWFDQPIRARNAWCYNAAELEPLDLPPDDDAG